MTTFVLAFLAFMAGFVLASVLGKSEAEEAWHDGFNEACTLQKAKEDLLRRAREGTRAAPPDASGA